MARGRILSAALTLAFCLALLGAASAVAAGPIAGTVTNQADQPLAGAEVCTWAPIDPLGEHEHCTQTNVAGEYSIPGSGLGARVRFVAAKDSATSYAPQWYPAVAHYEEATPVTEAQIEAGIDAVLTPGARISGKVVDNLTSEPLQGISVCPVDQVPHEGDPSGCEQSRSDGDYVLNNLPLGTYIVQVTPGEYENYVEAILRPPALGAGSVYEAEARLEPGVEVKGTIFDATTRQPVQWLGGPSVPICALEPVTARRLKCFVGKPDGTYVLAGVPAGTFILSFSKDRKEEGVDVNPDGYVRQFWTGAAHFDEATPITAAAGTVLEGYDPYLVQGAEDWSEEEAAPVLPIASTLPAAPIVQPSATAKPKPLRCKKGFRKVTKGGHARCVKIKKKTKRHHARKTHHPREKASHR